MFKYIIEYDKISKYLKVERGVSKGVPRHKREQRKVHRSIADYAKVTLGFVRS